jgi:hypothetical protein
MPSGRLFRLAAVPTRARPANNDTLRTVTPRPHFGRHAGFVLVLLGALIALLAVAGPAGAAQSCGRKVIDDWYDDGRVDGTYPLHCYDDAIEILPRDVRDYSSAKEDIQRAMTNALRGEPAPPATGDPSPTPGDEPTETTVDEEPPTKTSETETTPESDPKDENTPEAAPTSGDEESASSVPIPLLILAGLALLLIAGGSAGYLVRRFRGPQGPPPAV